MITSGPFGDQIADQSFGTNAAGSMNMVHVPTGYTVQTPSEASFDCGESSLQHLPFPGSSTANTGDTSAQQYKLIQIRLDQPLGPEYVSTRAGPGNSKLSYLEGWKVIDLANEIFGFNGWSTDASVSLDRIKESDGKFHVIASAIVRVTLRDGAYHTDVGSGIAVHPNEAEAISKAKKEAVTDGKKRALRTFGRMLGNCIYDNKFVARLANVKPQAPPSFDPSKLKRGPDGGTSSSNATRKKAGNGALDAQQSASKAAAGGTSPLSAHPLASETVNATTPTRVMQRQPSPPAQRQNKKSTAQDQTALVPQPRSGLPQQAAPQTEADRAKIERLQLAQARKAELARRSSKDAAPQASTTTSTSGPTLVSSSDQPKAPPQSDDDDGFDLVDLSMSQLNSLAAREQKLASSISSGENETKSSSNDVKAVLRVTLQASPSGRNVTDDFSPGSITGNKRMGETPAAREVNLQSHSKKSRYGF